MEDAAPRTRTTQQGMRFVVQLVHYFFESIGESVRVILREMQLFLGTGLLLAGLLNFNSDKYCDGNTAAYLSCTRPATFYYFDAIDITLIIIGIFFVLVWFVKKREVRA